MKGNINILILSCGRRVELVKAFKSARDKIGITGNVVCCDAGSDAPALYFGNKKLIVPRVSSESFIPKLIEVCNSEKISLIVPTIDTELLLLAENKKAIESQTNAKILVSDLETINICRDKTKSAEFFLANGFSLPYTYSKEELLKNKYKLPLFIKPKNGSSSVNAFRINTKEELAFFLTYVPEPIVQECVEGEEYTVDVFLDFEGKIVSCLPRLRIATRSGEILKGKIDCNKYIIENVKKVVSCFQGAIGHLTVQGFLGDDGVFKYIEINPRFGGGAPMAFRAGANSCEWLYCLLSGKEIDIDSIKIKDKVTFSRFDDCVEIV